VSSEWYLYLLGSAGGRTYVGIALDPARRLAEHNGERPGGARSTRAGRPWSLLRVHGPYPDRAAASRAEHQLKALRGPARRAAPAPPGLVRPAAPGGPMSALPLAAERAAALDAVLAASRVCQEVQRRLVAGGALAKGDKSPVTVADFAAQAIVSHLLFRAFPDVPLVGEEDAGALRQPENAGLKAQVVAAVQAVLPELDDAGVLAAIDRGVAEGGPAGRCWVLDPIDGTKGFLRQEQYAVALGLLEEGAVVLGALGCPALSPTAADGAPAEGCAFIAVRGQGAATRRLDDPAESPIRVDGVTDPAAARLCESVESGHTDQSSSARVAAALGLSAAPVRMDSQAKYAAVARGDASIYLRLPTRADYVERIWDHAAGAIVIEEAGGTVTDVDGRPLDFSRGRGLSGNRGVIATSGPVHAAVLAAVRGVLGG
jgi:HAL2 family 3'(2'),5'-bisphosphate nucleotidase